MAAAGLLQRSFKTVFIFSMLTVLTACGGGGSGENKSASSASSASISTISTASAAAEAPSSIASSAPSNSSPNSSIASSTTSSSLSTNPASSVSSSELANCVSPEIALADGLCGVPPPPVPPCGYDQIRNNDFSNCYLLDKPYPIYTPKNDEVVIYINSKDEALDNYSIFLWADDSCDGWADSQTDGYGTSVTMPFKWFDNLRVSSVPDDWAYYSPYRDPIYGAYFILKIKPGSTCGNFIIRNSNFSSQTKDLSINFSSVGSPYDRMFFVVDNTQDLRAAITSPTPICMNDLCSPLLNDVIDTPNTNVNAAPAIPPPTRQPFFYQGTLTVSTSTISADAIYTMGSGTLRVCSRSINDLLNINCVLIGDEFSSISFDPTNNYVTQESLAKTQIMFPAPDSITDKNYVLVRGTTSNQHTKVIGVQVNGVEAGTSDNYAHWQVEVPLILGANQLTVSVEDPLGYSENFAASSVIRQTIVETDADDIVLDLINHRTLQSVKNSSNLVATDLSNGTRTPISDASITLVNTRVDLLYDDNRDCVLIVDKTLKAPIIVDMITGEYVYFAK